MSTSKKTSSKSSKSPAPATKSAASKAAPASRAKAKVAAKPAAKAPAKPAAAPVVAASPAPAPKPQASRQVQTVISAKLDVGFGNALYIRGEGAGLSWDAGVPMECVEADLWRVTLPESARGPVFKFLVNDLTWSTGPDYSVESGAAVTLTPEF